MIDYIIVQAGGKGTRLQHLTANKPKALVPVDNLPILFHLFRKFPDKRFIIIGDYKNDVLKEYLRVFAGVKYTVVDASGKNGTCAGVSTAIGCIPENTPFMLIWCDLVLPEDFELPQDDKNYIGLSKGFSCRWKYENGRFEETPSDTCGVAGLFSFTDKSELNDVPCDGELVRWMQSDKKTFEILTLERTREFGVFSEYEKLSISRCRPFNRITEQDGKLLKEGIDEQGKTLSEREKKWYKAAKKLGFTSVPDIFSFEPFIMEKIVGKNIYEYDFNHEQRLVILEKLISIFKNLHSKGSIPSDYFSVQDAYVNKTFARIDKIRNLLPFGNERYITINKRKCHNIFYFKNDLERRFTNYKLKDFCFIHGDCTFSNIMLRNGTEPVLIDPRGYFGFTENYGDPAYDWAKLYYSIVGDYDRFNLKQFKLAINKDNIELSIETNGWRDMKNDFFRLLGNEVNISDINLIHAVIWLSLSTYAWEDYDSICGAFYNGLYYLEESLWSDTGI